MKNKTDLIADMDTFTIGYIECMLWLLPEDDALHDQANVEQITKKSLLEIIQDCKAFQESEKALLDKAGDESQNGHDFFLTRNGHGAGFWDRGYSDEIGKVLTNAAHAYGTQEAMSYRGKIDIHG